LEVVTAWLGLDQRAGAGDPQDRPLIFGTVARHLVTGDLCKRREWWAATEQEALKDHAQLLDRLQASRRR
jgi:hypothetical protein